ncbi:MAG: hypothetical protein U1E78_12035 [Gammaproteobacteria bacterium]
MECNTPILIHGGLHVIADAKAKILILDDDPVFLDVTARYINQRFNDSAIISKFSNSSSLIEHIQNHCYLPESPQDLIRSFYDNEITPDRVAQTLQELSELPAILIIDYTLTNEKLSGIDVVTKIREYYPCLFVVLLTGHVDMHDALSLHNNEVIDLFITKENVNALDDLCDYLHKKLNNFKKESHFETDEAFKSLEVLDSKHYLQSRESLLNNLPYKAYLTLCSSGKIAVLKEANQINIYQYQNGVFQLNE